MSAHSPTPWILMVSDDDEEEPRYVDVVQYLSHDPIASCGSAADANVANAEHIVRCVNAHDALVAALELFTSHSMGGSTGNGESSIGWQRGDGPTANERIAIARAALAKAKGE